MPDVQPIKEETGFYAAEYQKKVKTALLNISTDINKIAGNGIPVSQSKLSEYLDLLQDLIPLPEVHKTPSLTEMVREWVLSTEGVFQSTEIHRELKLSTPVHIKNLSTILTRLCKEGLIARHGDRRGQFRVIDKSLAPMNWKDADVAHTVDFKLPLGLHKYMYLYPRNIIVIAGDTNAGKTAYLLNAVRENAGKFEINYYTNDLTEEELRKRIDRFAEAGMDTTPFDDEKCNFIGRTKDFLDVMDADKVTIIDYLSVVEDAYKVANVLDDIYNKLRKGICIVAIQKKIGQKLGRGGDFAMERPRLYFTLERGKVYIQKMKNIIDPNKDPNGKCVKFTLWGGCKFIPDLKNGWQDIPKKSKEREPGEDDNLPF